MKNLKAKHYSHYLKNIYETYISGDAREESFYPYLKEFLEECARVSKESLRVTVSPKKTEAGTPDFLLRDEHKKIIGYIEAKGPEVKDLDDIAETEQLKRYRESLPNIILTNFLEFQLYRNGKLIKEVRLANPFTLITLKSKPAPEHTKEFEGLLEEFLSFSIPKTYTAKELAIELAKRTKFLRGLIKEELDKETEQVVGFYKAFRDELVESLTYDGFSDMYAQTITYGLFSARTRSGEEFNRDIAYKLIPPTIPLLKTMFYSLTGPNLPESLEWIVDDITDVLANAEISSILKDFHTTIWSDDPVIHFYETFLSEYNPKERERLGVYYTPAPVVSYIVRSIHKLLKAKFDKEDGFADRTVTLLDPAAGTLTFPAMAVRLVKKELEDKEKAGIFPALIREHILKNFYAFEILVAPYAIGHFKIAVVLEDLGYPLSEKERFRFYLTNSLEMKEPRQIDWLPDLAKEGERAKEVKEKIPILVVLGNPPYSVSSENKSEFIEDLMDDYKEDVRDERNIQPLSDDYIKFIRFAHWKVEGTGQGIVGYISNNAYLSGVIHRGMRRKLFETFDEIYILNLHGSSRIGERTPEGGKDKNVFDIQQGVAIALFAKLKDSKANKKVYYADVWGLREEKYNYLFGNDVESSEWQELQPEKPYYFFVPKEFVGKELYEKFWKVTEIFREFQIGLMTGQDELFVDSNPQSLKARIFAIFNRRLGDKELKMLYQLNSQAGEKTLRARKQAFFDEKLIKSYGYRPFDIRYLYAENKFLWRSVENLKRHFEFDNIALVTTRILSKGPFKHAFISQFIGDNTFISSRTKERNYFIPLYLYAIPSTEGLFQEPISKKPNFTPEFLNTIQEALGKEPSPEGIFYYIYAILYSNTYRKKYEEFLKIDFPRIPLTNDFEIFQNLSTLGKELVELHLLKSPRLKKVVAKYPISGSDKVEKSQYDVASGRVYINKQQYFNGISKEFWEYYIGSYQVLNKWLKDRKGRQLTLEEIEHYLKIIAAIKFTIELQHRIDGLYSQLEETMAMRGSR